MINSVAIIVLCLSCGAHDDPRPSRPHDPSALRATPADWIQIERNQRWCGAKALWLIARCYGRDDSLEQIQAICDPDGMSAGDLSLDALRRAALELNLEAMAIHCKLSWLAQTKLPAISLHRHDPSRRNDPREWNSNQHFVIVLGHSDAGFEVIDPLVVSRPITIPDAKFEETWTGDVLLIAKSKDALPRNRAWLVVLAYFPPLLIAIVLLIGLSKRLSRNHVRSVVASSVLLFVAGGCSQKNAGLVFEERLYDAGIVRDEPAEVLIHHPFRYVNHSSQPVQISRVVPGCSCARVEYPQDPIQPKQDGEIVVWVDLKGRIGQFTTFATLKVDDADGIESESVLTITSFVLKSPSTVPSVFDFGTVTAGENHKRTAEVQVFFAPDESRLVIDEVRGTNDMVRYECGPVAIEDGAPLGKYRVARFNVEASMTPEHPGEEMEDCLSIRIAGRSQELLVPLRACCVHPALSVNPPKINFGPIGPSGVVRKVTLRSANGAPPPVESVFAPSSGVGIRAWLEPNRVDQAETILCVEATHITSGFLEGTLILRIRDSPFQECRVPYSGYALSQTGS